MAGGVVGVMAAPVAVAAVGLGTTSAMALSTVKGSLVVAGALVGYRSRNQETTQVNAPVMVLFYLCIICCERSRTACADQDDPFPFSSNGLKCLRSLQKAMSMEVAKGYWAKQARRVKKEAKLCDSIYTTDKTFLSHLTGSEYLEDIDEGDTLRWLVAKILTSSDTLPGYLHKALIKRFREKYPGTYPEEEELKALIPSTPILKPVSSPMQAVGDALWSRFSFVGEVGSPSNKEGQNSSDDENEEEDSEEEGQEESRVKDAHDLLHEVTLAVLDFCPSLRTDSQRVEMVIICTERLLLSEMYSVVFEEIRERHKEEGSHLSLLYLCREHGMPISIPSGALQSLHMVSEAHNGHDKLRCMVRCCQALMTRQDQASADDLLPLLQEAILCAQVKDLPAELGFIEEFCVDDPTLMGEDGYALVSMQVALGSMIREHVVSMERGREGGGCTEEEDL